MIKVQITLGDDYLTPETAEDSFSTEFKVNNIAEIEGELKKRHTMNDLARDYYEKKGTLDAQLATGWWYYNVSTKATKD